MAIEGAPAYDVVRGDLAILHASRGDFTAATQACLGNDLTGTSLDVADGPLVGSAIWYLVRPVNCGGHGTYDSGDPGQVGSRDPGSTPRPRPVRELLCRLLSSSTSTYTSPMCILQLQIWGSVTMHRRINITLPEETIRLIERVAKKGDRSFLISEAVHRYVASVGKTRLRRLLKEGARLNADRDLKLAEEWAGLE